MKMTETKKIITAGLSTLMIIALASCWSQFDENSYKPKFTINGFTSVKDIGSGSLVAYWALENSLLDSVSKEIGSNSGASYVEGFKGTAINFDVTNKSYFTFTPGSSITGVQSFTISFWVNPKFIDADNNGTIDGILGLVNLSNPTGFWGDLDWFVENGSNNDAAKVVVHVVSGANETWMNFSNYKGLFNSWSNHTLTYDAASSTFTYYLNATKMFSQTTSYTNTTFSGFGDMVFGCVQFQTANGGIGCCGAQPWASWLTGAMDEIRVYNKALSASEIQAMTVLQGKGK